MSPLPSSLLPRSSALPQGGESTFLTKALSPMILESGQNLSLFGSLRPDPNFSKLDMGIHPFGWCQGSAQRVLGQVLPLAKLFTN